LRQILLKEARPGDQVAEPVVNERGMTILPKGARLTAAIISRLQKMNVVDLVVEGRDPGAPPPKTLGEQLSDLEARFRGLEGNATMMAIYRTAREHLTARAGGEG
jgi:hypothetical protein